MKLTEEQLNIIAQNTSPALLGGIIEHTLLNSQATQIDLENLCKEANEIGSSVCINEGRLKEIFKYVNQRGLRKLRQIVVVIGFPLGATSTEIKASSALHCLNSGADELDMVLNIGYLKDDPKKCKEDILTVAQTVAEFNKIHKSNKILKVIQENCYLSDDEKKLASHMIAEVAQETELQMFAKTSTGFGKPKDSSVPVGATVSDVALMYEIIKPFQEQGVAIGIKAAGGVSNSVTALEMMSAAGCFDENLKPLPNIANVFRIGTSTGKKIIDDFKQRFKK
ncbi:MAG: Deoxyribose-phosphate aldolase [candidate division CPR1 bacterium GW2011_GWA2_42_17]|uniref:Deoxyribose-phosphate aldolase n=1 Tax=candidate division CPR1 bacterium GW2011_GWA2_42_17 TaxID=1618341 RepID=A0A0G1BYN6_9BACT|nr:MAG: Deoxyribose-phosphate aldolase [candidate division CPR1 bacterium GW2011_GWA2_42_17]